MDIYLSEVSKKGSKFRFPSLPEKISVKNGARYQSFEIIGAGSVSIPRGTEVGSVSWSGIFYGKSKRKEAMTRKWTSPADCKKILKKWMNAGTVLRLLATGIGINLDVTIREFEYEEYGAYGNAEYTISFTVHKELKIYTTSEKKKSPKDTKMDIRPIPEKSKSYTVVSGDNLWSIAKKCYGSDSSGWKKIYDANKAIIEKVAKQRGKASSDNGKWIFPGTVLTIP